MINSYEYYRGNNANELVMDLYRKKERKKGKKEKGEENFTGLMTKRAKKLLGGKSTTPKLSDS